jgi:hypothetical protein
MCRVALYLHTAAAAKSLLATPEFPVYESLIDGQACRKPRQHGYQAFSVRLACG